MKFLFTRLIVCLAFSCLAAVGLFAQAPVNDSPCGAIEALPGVPIAFDLSDATPNPGWTPGPGTQPGSCNQQDGWCFFEIGAQNSLYYYVVVPPSGCINVLASGLDVQLALWDVGDCNDPTSSSVIAANDDSGSLLDPSLPNSGPAGLVEVSCLNPGDTLVIQLDGFNGGVGQGVLSVTDCGNNPLTLDLGGCQTQVTPSDTNFLTATVTGGFPPYTIHWVSDSSTMYKNEDFNGMAVQPTVTTNYFCSVTDAKGCGLSESITVEVLQPVTCTYAPSAGDFRTQTQGGWGSRARGGNAGVYRDANFAAAFPNGISVGCTNTLTLTSSAEVDAFLPSGSTPKALTQNYTDPSRSYRNVLAGQVVTLGLSLGFDAYDPNYSASTTALGDLVVASGPLAGKTVFEVYAYAQQALGGCASPYSLSQLNSAVSSINENFVDGNSAGSFLVIEGVIVCYNDGTSLSELCVSPSSLSSLLATPGYSSGPCNSGGNTCNASNNSFPPPPPCQTLKLTMYADLFSQLDNDWQIIDLYNGNIVQPSTVPNPLMQDVYTYCLNPTHCYEFTIFDQSGDGWDPLFGGGYYSIEFLGETTTSPFADPFGGQIFSESQLIGSACNSNKTIVQDDPIAAEASHVAVFEDEMNFRAYPNPFSDNAVLEFTLLNDDHAKVEILSITGEIVAVPFDNDVFANHVNTANIEGKDLPNGMYFYRVTTKNGVVKDGKILLQR